MHASSPLPLPPLVGAGHPEAHIHSGESAVIAPRLVAGLGRRQVTAVAAAKHHTVLCTTAGEVFTCGSNRYGQLGYAVDTQPTPRRVAALRQRVVAVAAANKHSVAVTSAGEVYTWGTNTLGQVGGGVSWGSPCACRSGRAWWPAGVVLQPQSEPARAPCPRRYAAGVWHV